MIKKIIILFIWALLFAALVVYMVYTEKRHKEVVCDVLSIRIKYNGTDTFLLEEDILDHLAKNGFKIIGEPLAGISAGEIETSLYTIPYVDKAEVYVTIEGNVKINITQRRPIVRIINTGNKSYYIDDTGLLLPGSDKYTARLLVANGEIRNYYLPNYKLRQEDSLHPDTAIINSPLYKIFMMAQFIDCDTFWRPMIEEIYITEKNEMELYTKVGDAAIIFGDTDNMKEKFDKLFIFFKEGLNKFGWGRYKRINLKYKNQVVCSKS